MIRASSLNKCAVAGLTVLATGGALADDGALEWSVLGPAWSDHLSTTFAPETVGPATSKTAWECSTDTSWNQKLPGGGSISTSTGTLPTTVGALPTNLGNPTSTSSHGVTYDSYPAKTSATGVTKQTVCDNAAKVGVPGSVHHVWHQANPAIGLEVSRHNNDHADLAYVDMVRDSLGTESLMFGVGRQWSIGHIASVDFSAGVTAGAWWRSDVVGYRDGGWDNHVYRTVTPYIFPAVTATERHTGIGLNLAFAPALVVGGHIANNTPAFLLQMTYQLK
jgi:hypothetical protein